jgi:hypothetical protein
MAGLALLAAACGGSPRSPVTQLGSGTTTVGSSAAASTQNDGAVAFARCMRAHGVSRFPDPVGGGIPKVDLHRLGVSSSQFATAQGACQHLLPASDVGASVTTCLSTGDCPSALLHRIMSEGLVFARCMRAHGVRSWPDPSRDPENGAPEFDLMAIHDIDWRSPQIDRKLDQCQHVYSTGVRVGLRRP